VCELILFVVAIVNLNWLVSKLHP